MEELRKKRLDNSILEEFNIKSQLEGIVGEKKDDIPHPHTQRKQQWISVQITAQKLVEKMKMGHQQRWTVSEMDSPY